MKQAIAANYLKILDKCLQECGVTDFLKHIGISHTRINDPSAWLDSEECTVIIKKAYELSHCSWLGLMFGEHLSIANHGFLGYAAMTSPTLRTAIQTFLRFLTVRTGLLCGHFYDNQTPHHDTFVEFSLITCDPLIERFLTEIAIMHITRLCAFLTGESTSCVRIDVAYPKPCYQAYYTQLLHTNMMFDAPVTRVWFLTDALNASISFADDASYQQANTQLQTLANQLMEQNDLPEKIKKILIKHECNKLSMPYVADKLCMTPRTLRRHLQRYQITYQELFDDVRCQKARELLTNNALSITEISFLLGFHDVSSFSKAFKHWTSQTPSEYRCRD